MYVVPPRQPGYYMLCLKCFVSQSEQQWISCHVFYVLVVPVIRRLPRNLKLKVLIPFLSPLVHFYSL